MESKRLRQCVCLVVLLSSLSQVACQKKTAYYYYKPSPSTSAERPLVKRPEGTTYKTLISVDGGGLRLLLTSMVYIEMEQSIKRYLLANPQYLPAGYHITSIDDFDINLADYFDFMTGTSAGAWISLYLATRGGQGASRAVFDDPDIVERYGYIPSGSAEGLRVLFREYATVIYPPEAINASAGTPGDLSNPLAPGVAAPLYPLDGIEATMEAFLGDTTLADCDTSVLITSYDLLSGYTTLFLANLLGDRPTTSAARMVPRSSPKTTFVPDLVFEEGDYFLVDVGTASSAPAALNPAKSVTQIGNDEMEFLLIDGAFPLEYAVLPASFICVAETGEFNFEKLAIVSIGAGIVVTDRSPLANAGLAGWLQGGLLGLYFSSGLDSQSSLIDYIYYSNPNTKPYQYLRINTEEYSAESEIGMALSLPFGQSDLLDLYEEIGTATAARYREAIDIFVRTFMFY